ncbi:hypothetical protein [Nocardia carnea]|uniref:hypothetical protein n=1 Tax=Nocardia carnea TaxID=37328 RepID=UPI0024576B95|nr:hypothetical protein [Nocardia carnea]
MSAGRNYNHIHRSRQAREQPAHPIGVLLNRDVDEMHVVRTGQSPDSGRSYVEIQPE